MCRRFGGFMERIKKGEFHVSTNTSPFSELYPPQKLSYSFVVKNPPPLKTPLERKNFIESACVEALDATKVELRPGKNGWHMAVAHKATAEKTGTSDEKYKFRIRYQSKNFFVERSD